MLLNNDIYMAAIEHAFEIKKVLSIKAIIYRTNNKKTLYGAFM